MAERLGRALQKLVQRFESARCLHVLLFLECFIPAHLLCSVSLVAIRTEDAAFFHFDHDVWPRVSQSDCLHWVWRVPVAVFLTKKSLFGLCSPHFEHGFMIRKNRL